MHGTAVVFLTHLWSEAIARRFTRLWREASPVADVFLLLQSDDANVASRWDTALAGIGASDALFRFSAATLPSQLGLPYFGMRGVLSNAHFPLLLFARSHPHSFYWQVEYDVELRGAWRPFLEARSDGDAALIASHFHNINEWPDWFWWMSFTRPASVAMQATQLYKAFMAIARFSHRALQEVEQAHRDGWAGHFEAVIPTVLLRAGHHLEDLNVRGPCYASGVPDPVPLLAMQSSVRARPAISLPELRNRGHGALLFHPVKDEWIFDGSEVLDLAASGAVPPTA
ncbi:MAG TPA: hypothetical protein VIE63_08450 [Ramlibacter sp.]